MKPLVSVIMPAYNGEKYIGEAIESILNQTYDNFELIIVEDKSTDKTLEVIKRYHDSRIYLFLNSENRGISYSTNLGISKSRGKYIALLDDDDKATEHRLEWQAAFMEEHEEVDILGGRSAIINKDGDFIQYVEEPLRNPKYIKAYLLFYNRKFANCTTMIRKRFLEDNNLKYQENCLGMQDHKFFIDSSKIGTITSIDRLLHFKRIHDEEANLVNQKIYGRERAALFAQFQRESLEKSGFRLGEEDLRAINDIITEGIKLKCSRDDAIRLYKAFKEIIRQAQAMDIDYLAELEHVCKRILCERILLKMDFSDWEI